MTSNNETEQLKHLLSKVQKQAHTGASLMDIMDVFKKELPRITKYETRSVEKANS